MSFRHAAYGFIVTLACGASSIAFAQKVPPAEAFGALESVQSANLSPDGKLLSFIAPQKGGGNILFVVPVDGSTPPKRLASAGGAPEQLLWCSWAGKIRLICKLGAVKRAAGYVLGATQMLAIDADGSNLKVLAKRSGQEALYATGYGGTLVDLLPDDDDAILMLQWNVPEFSTGTNLASNREGYSLDRVDTRTLKTKSLTPATVENGEYITDGLGNIRIMGVTRMTGNSVMTGVIKYKYKKKDGGGWLDLGEWDSRTSGGFNPYAVDPVEDVAYGFQKKDGRLALFKRTLGDQWQESLVYAHPQVDVDGLIRIGRKRRVVGVSYATDKRNAVYFEPALAKLRTALSKALPKTPLIDFLGATDDEQKLLLMASSDSDPGTLYLLDRTSRHMAPLLAVRPELEDYKLAEVRPVQLKAADGTLIPGYLTLPPGSSGKNLPALVMPHGGPEARDEWGFDWLAQYFANQGFAVLQPNFRGSAGYGENWFLNNGYQSWRTAIGDVTDAGRWLVSEGIADPAKLGIFGWSYGGYAALQSGAIAPELFKAIVAVAPVTDLAAHRDRDIDTPLARLTRERIGSGPHVTEGSPYRNADKIVAPVLMFHGDVDQNVLVGQGRMMEDALKSRGKRVELVVYKGLEHSLVDAGARAEMLRKSKAHFDAAFGTK